MADPTLKQTPPAGPGRPLSGRYFHNQDVFQQEQKSLFTGAWLCAGHSSELEEVGDYFTRYLGHEPLLFSRSEAGVQGFYNVCRHRGTRLVEAECGHGAKNFQCPYHAWTYGLDGTLIGAPRMRGVEGFDPAKLGLLPIPTEEWNGFIFYRLATPLESDAEPGSVAEQMLDFPDISAYGCEDLVSTSRKRYEVKANWKVLCQNYGECYHCALVHPQLNEISNYLSGGDQKQGDCFVGGPMTLNEGYNTMNMTGLTDRPSLPGVEEADERDVLFYNVYPNFLLSLHRDYVISHVLWPTGPETTTIVCDWLFHRDEAKQSDFDDSSEVEFWHVTNQQDWAICEQTQLGARSRGYRPVMYQEGEGCLAEFDRWYLGAMGDSGVLSADTLQIEKCSA